MPGLTRRELAVLALAALAGTPVRAQGEFPERPVRWIVPYAAGTGPDIVARTVGAQLALDAGQPVQIENRAGGNTALGAIEAARAPADGCTVLSADNATLVFNPAIYRHLGYDPARDLAPVTLIGRLPMVLLVGPASGVRDARAFIEDARAFPGKVSYASAGIGSVQHLAMALLGREAGLRMEHAAYRGAAPALADLAGGHVGAMMCDLFAGQRFIRSGRVRALAVAAPARLPLLPGVPAFAELGLPRVEAAALLGLAVPAATPDDRVAQLQQAVASAVHAPAALQRLAEVHVEPVGGTRAQFEALIGSETARWRGLIRDLDLSLD